MILPRYEVLNGRVSDAESHKGALEFMLEGRSVAIDGLGGGMRRPFTDGDDIEVVVRRGLILRAVSTAYAYRMSGSSRIRTAPRWRSLALFVPGVAFAVFLLVGWAFFGFRFDFPEDLKGFAAGAVLVLWGGQGLLCHSIAAKILAATPNKSPGRTREG